jgi:aryl-alcohol dehydrogenase-like predicted oxidoreductase
MHRPSVTAPIASATNREQLDELLLAAEITLSEKELKLLGDASAS